jgi:hypothetical protein
MAIPDTMFDTMHLKIGNDGDFADMTFNNGSASEPEMEPYSAFVRQLSEMSEMSAGGFSRQQTEQFWPTWRGTHIPAIPATPAMNAMNGFPFPFPTPWLGEAVPHTMPYPAVVDQIQTKVVATGAPKPSKVAKQEPAQEPQQKKSRKGRKKAKSLIDLAAKQKLPAELQQKKGTQTGAATTPVTTQAADMAPPNGAVSGAEGGNVQFCPYCGGKCAGNFKFCRFCGVPLSMSPADAAALK